MFAFRNADSAISMAAAFVFVPVRVIGSISLVPMVKIFSYILFILQIFTIIAIVFSIH